MCHLTEKKVLICSSHEIYCDVLSQAIMHRSDQYRIVSKQKELEGATFILERTAVDFILLNIDFKIKDPVEFVRSFKKQHPTVLLIILTFWDYPNFHNRIMQAGANALYVTNWRIEKLLESMEQYYHEGYCDNFGHTGGIIKNEQGLIMGN